MAQNKLISIGGLQHFLEKLKNEVFAPKEHKHQATEIIESAEKKFVSDTQIARWNDTYTKGETDQKLGDLVKGLEWKAAVDTFEDIATTYPEPKEGWTVSVKDTNHIYRYDDQTQTWIDIGQSADIPLASEHVNGLLKKEDFVQLQNLQGNLDSKLGKEENAVSATKLQTARNINGQSFDGTKDITINSDAIPQGETNLFCTTEEKTSWSDKYTKNETDGKVTKLNETINETKEELKQAITTATTPATDEEIDAIFITPAILQSVTPESHTLKVGETVEVKWIFDKDPLALHIGSTKPTLNNTNASVSIEPTIATGEKAIKATYKADKTGSTEISLKIGSVTKTCTLTIQEAGKSKK